MTPRQRKFARQFETLEGRSMLAGNVTAMAGAGSLYIFGDSSDNMISVRSVSHNRFEIIGIGTKVNGSTKKFTSDPVAGDEVIINLDQGNDVLNLHNANVAGVLIIEMGTGNDTATLKNINIGSFLIFEGGDGNDVLTVNHLHVSDPNFEFTSTIDMQDGNDTVALNDFRYQHLLELTLGNGNDTLAITNSAFLGDPFEILHIRSLRIDAGDGTDVVSLISVETGSLFVDVGPGKKDVLSIVNSKADTATLLDTGGKTGIISGAGNDFGTQTIDPNFTIRSGDLRHDTV